MLVGRCSAFLVVGRCPLLVACCLLFLLDVGCSCLFVVLLLVYCFVLCVVCRVSCVV